LSYFGFFKLKNTFTFIFTLTMAQGTLVSSNALQLGAILSLGKVAYGNEALLILQPALG